MSIEFQCGACGKSLKTTDDKAGRRARCPECGEMLVVPSPDTQADEFDFNFEEAPVPGGTFNIGPPQVEEKLPPERPRMRSEPKEPCPMCGELVGRSKKTCPYCGESLGRNPRRRSGTGQNQIAVDEVFGQAWGAFNQSMGLSIGAVVLAFGLMFAAIMAVSAFVGTTFGIGLMAVASSGSGNPFAALGVGLLVFILLVFAFILFVDWVYLGLVRMFIRITRGDHRAELADLFTGGPQLMRHFGIVLLVTVATYATLFVCAVVFAIIGVLPLLILLIFGLVLFLGLKLWAIPFVLVDQDPPGLGALSSAFQIMSGNHLTMFLVFLLTGLINLAGILMLGIGLIFTLPFTFLILASAYDLMTDDDYEAEYV